MDPQAGQVPSGGDDGQTPIAKPQAGAAPITEPKAETPQAGEDAKELSEKKKLRDEAAASRIRAKNAEDELQKLRDSLKSEDERKSDELKRLQLAEATWRDQERAHALETAITKALIGSETLDVDIVEGLLKKADLTIDPDSGKPTADSLSATLAALKESKPFLFKAPVSADPAPPVAPKATSAGAGTNMQRKQGLTMAAIQRMSNQEINDNWEAVNEVLQSTAPKAGANQFDYLTPMGRG